MAAKGSRYERYLCLKLSRWWTNGRRDDIFWRTSGSGARAKHRSRAGLHTAFQAGDVTATDPIGAPLLDLVTIEIKRGYSKFTLADLLDSPNHSQQQKIEEWLQQTIESYIRSGAFAWLLIIKRDMREEIVLMPGRLYERLKFKTFDKFPTVVMVDTDIRFAFGKGKKRRIYTSLRETVYALKLNDFLERVSPEDIRSLCMEC